jgi:nucleoid-associated protein YgaU
MFNNIVTLATYFEERSPQPPFPDETKPPRVDPPEGGNGNGKQREYVVLKGDSLSLIAGKFYRDVLLWPVIYDDKLNRNRIGENFNLIQPGLRLNIPSISGYSQPELTKIRDRGRNWRA